MISVRAAKGGLHAEEFWRFRHRRVCAFFCCNRGVRPSTKRGPDAKPTVKQVYALARELCERAGEEFPQKRGEASELIERLRAENGRS